MKKLCVSAVVAGVLAMSVSYAYAGAIKVTRDIENESFTVSGKASPDSVARALVTAPGKTYSDAISAQNPFDIIKYQNETDVSDDGNFVFEVELASDSGVYTAYIAVDGSVDEVKLEYINPDGYSGVIDGLNIASDIENYIETNGNDLGFFLDLYDNVNKSTVCSMIEKKLPLSADNAEENVAVFNNAVIAVAISEGKITGISDYADKIYMLNNNSVSDKWYKFTDKNEVDSRINGNFATVEDFERALNEAIVLSVVKNPQGYLNVKSVISDFSSEIGIAVPSAADDVYRALAGKSFGSYAELRNAYSSNLTFSNAGGTSGGSSGGGSGSSSGGGSSFVPGVTITKEPMTPIVRKHFSDMESALWAEEAVEYLAEKNILSGKAENTFAPMDMVTREEFITIIVKAFDIEKYVDANTFDDISKNDWCYEYVLAAEQNGITTGIGNNLFGKGENITRQDMASILYRVVNQNGINIKSEVKSVEFTDEIADYAKEAVEYLSARGIVNGMGDGAFAGKNNATRAQAAQMVYGILKNMEV